MDIEYTWILRQGKNCCQFRLLTWTSHIGQFVHPVGGDLLYDNQMSDPSNNKLIKVLQLYMCLECN